jgi:hypothetical protein
LPDLPAEDAVHDFARALVFATKRVILEDLTTGDGER